MEKIIFGFFILALVSCKNFETKKVSSEDILRQQLQDFNWTEVDVYPTFAACDKFEEKQALKVCFETTITKHLYQALAKHPIASGDTINDTVMLYLTISDQGNPKIDSLAISEKLARQIPDLKKWIASGVDNLPEIYPARTRGMPVTTKFMLPIIVISE